MSDEKEVEKEIVIAADADAVWRALTEAEELKRWFPLDARVTPGEGGAVWVSWGEGADWESRIEIWKPKEQLRTVDPLPAGAPPDARKMMVDYFLEARGGETMLRLVHSGFAADTWDDELDTLDAGWGAFLQTLKHYLERHPGEPRQLVFARHAPVPLTRPDIFPRALHALGFTDESIAQLRPGAPYAVTTRDGDHFEGIVRSCRAPIGLSATVDNWNDAFLMVEIEPGRERCRPAFWFSLYGTARDLGEALQVRLRALLEDEFAKSEE